MEHAGSAISSPQEQPLLPDRAQSAFETWCRGRWSWFGTTWIGNHVVPFLNETQLGSWIKTWGVVPLAAAWSTFLFMCPFILKNEPNLTVFVALFLTLWNCVVWFVICMVKPKLDNQTGIMVVVNIVGFLCEAAHLYRLAYWEWDAIVIGLLVVFPSVVWAIILWCCSTTPSVLFEGLSKLGIATTASVGVVPLLVAFMSKIPLHFNLWLALFSMGNAAMWTLHGFFSIQGAIAAANAISCVCSCITFVWALFV